MSKDDPVVQILIQNAAADDKLIEAIKMIVEYSQSRTMSSDLEASFSVEMSPQSPSARPARKVGHGGEKSDIIKELKDHLATKEGFVEDRDKRIYRRKADLFDPSAKPTDEVNKLSSKLTPRVSRAHVDLFNSCASEFPNKRAALERAVELLALETGVKIDFE